VNLFSQEGADISAMQLPGRRSCSCQASKHKLVTNCLHCGRIVCEQEGAGPCLFCGTMVDVGDGGSASYGVPKGKAAEALHRANEHKNKILQRDKEGTRSQVIDDESDHFHTSSSWLSPQQRQAVDKYKAQLEKAKAERARSFTLDFAGRQVCRTEASAEAVDATHVDSLIRALAGTDLGQAPASGSSGGGSSDTFQPQYRADPRRQMDVDGLFRPRAASQLQRVQDDQLQLLSDDGMCLSMHQPWASLLTAGVKIHEGRSWYTPYRGRLWIAAAAKVPTQQEIREMEDFYRLRAGKELKFPEFYPTGCLLGRVSVGDCVPQEVYREQFPDGESESPYVLICADPQELLVKFPMKGQHKIYKMDTSIHQAAKKMLTVK